MTASNPHTGRGSRLGVCVAALVITLAAMRTFTNEHGTFQIRDSLFSGPGGFLRFESTWQVTNYGFRLTTVIPIGGP